MRGIACVQVHVCGQPTRTSISAEESLLCFCCIDNMRSLAGSLMVRMAATFCSSASASLAGRRTTGELLLLRLLLAAAHVC